MESTELTTEGVGDANHSLDQNLATSFTGKSRIEGPKSSQRRYEFTDKIDNNDKKSRTGQMA